MAIVLGQTATGCGERRGGVQSGGQLWCERPGPITGPMQTRVLHQLVKMGRHLRQSHATRRKGRMGKGTCGEAEHREMERGVCE